MTDCVFPLCIAVVDVVDVVVVVVDVAVDVVVVDQRSFCTSKRSLLIPKKGQRVLFKLPIRF